MEEIKFRWLVTVAALLVSLPTVADRAPYGGKVNLEVRNDVVAFRHHHDWSKALETIGKTVRFSLAEPFGAGNDYSYISAHLLIDGVEIWRAPSPPLTWMDLSSDGRFIIGLSNVKFLNNTQLAVYDIHGTLLARTEVAGKFECVSRATRDAEIAQRPAEQRRVWAEFTRPACLPNVENFSGSVTNRIDWYSETAPAPRVVEADGYIVAVELKDAKGADLRVPLESILKK